ncbi:phage protease [Nitrincola sp.]|uniref:phage protease n=1 Tax=Nitrincola sp. TaxID=1926584 RepID=UPI003A90022C
MTRTSTLAEIMTALRSTPKHKDSGITAINMQGGKVQNGWQRLLPDGHFKAVDGRPFDTLSGYWYLDEAAAKQIIAKVHQTQTELVIDYEHQTLLSQQNGHPAPAAGWFKDIEWREGSGLWVKPHWTKRALEFLASGEYRYLSAVFPYDKNSGSPSALHSAALVNRPGLDGVTEITALSANLTPQLSQPAKAPTPYPLVSLSAKEKSACYAANHSTNAYLSKRDLYCMKRGSNWAQLTALTPDDMNMIRYLGQDAASFQLAKIQLLAEEVLRS